MGKIEKIGKVEVERECIGARASDNFITVDARLGVREAMSALVAQAGERDNVSTVYAVGEGGRLVGAIVLGDLIVARAGDRLSDVINTDCPALPASLPCDECIELLRSLEGDQLALTDGDGRLIGVLTHREIAALVEEAISEDYARLGGLAEEESATEPLTRSVSARLPWLCLLFLLGLGVSGVIGLFERLTAERAVIVAFQSLILGMAGNVGTQSLAVTVRALADGEPTRRERARLIAKEARVGGAVGAALGLLSFLLVGALLALTDRSPSDAFSVSLCVGAALSVSMLLSGVSGSAIPILLDAIGVDPAVASGPFITTLNDLVAVLAYYGLAYLILL